nr:AAA family ATPase [Chitinophagales bacterium]
MYIYRNAEKKLEAWKKSSQKKPLILRGARQVGKTKLVHHFANTYSQKILLNLEREEDRLLFDTMPIDKLVAYLLLKYN